MFSRQINEKTEIRLTIPHHADELFALIDKNRTMLRKWLPWLDQANNTEDTKNFINGELGRFAKSKALLTTIFHEGNTAGAVAFNTIDMQNQIGYIGYWLGHEFQGKGIMTDCVKGLMKIGEDYLSLRRFEIRCAVTNMKSRAIPERLDFVNEGTLRCVEKVYENWFDHVVYGKLVNKDHTN